MSIAPGGRALGSFLSGSAPTESDAGSPHHPSPPAQRAFNAFEILGRVLPQDSPRNLSVALGPSLAPWFETREKCLAYLGHRTRRALPGTWVVAVAHACGQDGIGALSSRRLGGRLISSACSAACRSRPAVSLASSALVPWLLWK